MTLGCTLLWNEYMLYLMTKRFKEYILNEGNHDTIHFDNEVIGDDEEITVERNQNQWNPTSIDINS